PAPLLLLIFHAVPRSLYLFSSSLSCSILPLAAPQSVPRVPWGWHERARRRGEREWQRDEEGRRARRWQGVWPPLAYADVAGEGRWNTNLGSLHRNVKWIKKTGLFIGK